MLKVYRYTIDAAESMAIWDTTLCGQTSSLSCSVWMDSLDAGFSLAYM